jgi:hypothetical protein
MNKTFLALKLTLLWEKLLPEFVKENGILKQKEFQMSIFYDKK